MPAIGPKQSAAILVAALLLCCHRSNLSAAKDRPLRQPERTPMNPQQMYEACTDALGAFVRSAGFTDGKGGDGDVP